MTEVVVQLDEAIEQLELYAERYDAEAAERKERQSALPAVEAEGEA